MSLDARLDEEFYWDVVEEILTTLFDELAQEEEAGSPHARS